jgi:hypothetical protein
MDVKSQFSFHFSLKKGLRVAGWSSLIALLILTSCLLHIGGVSDQACWERLLSCIRDLKFLFP